MKPADRSYLYNIIRAGLDLVDDKQASVGVVLYPEMQYENALIKAGSRINWNGTLKRAAVDLWDSVENNPDNAPALWEEIAYLNGYRVLTGHISASNPVQPGEMCWEDGKLYRCIYHVACTYRPSEYAAAWEEVTDE